MGELNVQAILAHLSTKLYEHVKLEEMLEELGCAKEPPRIRVYITEPNGPEDPLISGYRIGARVDYWDKDGYPEQFGSLIRISELRDMRFLEKCVHVLGTDLARGIQQHEENKKPLPTRPLTPEVRARLELPF